MPGLGDYLVSKPAAAPPAPASPPPAPPVDTPVESAPAPAAKPVATPAAPVQKPAASRPGSPPPSAGSPPSRPASGDGPAKPLRLPTVEVKGEVPTDPVPRAQNRNDILSDLDYQIEGLKRQMARTAARAQAANAARQAQRAPQADAEGAIAAAANREIAEAQEPAQAELRQQREMLAALEAKKREVAGEFTYTQMVDLGENTREVYVPQRASTPTPPAPTKPPADLQRHLKETHPPPLETRDLSARATQDRIDAARAELTEKGTLKGVRVPPDQREIILKRLDGVEKNLLQARQ